MLPQPAIEFEVARAGGLTVFDCRWNTPRRMGIGDKIVVCAAIQQIAAAGIRVAALWNPADEELFRLMSIPAPGGETIGSLIPWTDHVMAIPVGMTGPEVDRVDAACRHPIERALWGIGLHCFSKPTPEYAWDVPAKRKRPGILAWCPVEISRRYCPITTDEWKPLIERLMDEHGIQHIELWCGMREQPAAFDFISLLPARLLAQRITIRSAFTMREWIEQFLGAACILTANTAGLWIALGLPVPAVVVQRTATIPHMALWQARPGWNGGRCRVVELEHKKSPGPLTGRELWASLYPAVPLGLPHHPPKAIAQTA